MKLVFCLLQAILFTNKQISPLLKESEVKTWCPAELSPKESVGAKLVHTSAVVL
jgi:hypothetical protein